MSTLDKIFYAMLLFIPAAIATFYLSFPPLAVFACAALAIVPLAKLIGESTRLTFAALCIGDNFTMGIDDAIKAAEFVRCSEILGLHYNTFAPIKIDAPAAVGKFKAARQNLHLLAPGASHNF